MSNDSVISAARASLDAYNSKNWDAVRLSVTDDCVYDETATHRKVEGIAAILEVWQGWAAAMPDSRATYEATYAIEGGAVFELTWRGTNTGPMQGPDGEIPATGKSFEMRGCQVIEMDGDKAKVIRHYFDIGTMMSQLGLA
jgi:steroid delta-isomerase-like uncharacterized protein